MPNDKNARKIAGALSVDTESGPQTFVAGQEEQLAAFLETEKGRKLDVEKHSKDGVLVGFGKATAEAKQARTKNKQRDESGEPAEQPAEGTDGPMVLLPPEVVTAEEAAELAAAAQAEQAETDVAPRGRRAR